MPSEAPADINPDVEENIDIDIDIAVILINVEMNVDVALAPQANSLFIDHNGRVKQVSRCCLVDIYTKCPDNKIFRGAE